MERAEQPPPKKSKAEVFDELFGNEDVDLRQLPPPVALVKPQTTIGLPLSPPPPPIISQPSPVPTSSLSSSSQDSSVNTISSPKRSSPEREKEDTESRAKETKAMDDDSKENNDSGLKPKGWAKFKETFKSPLRPLVSFPDEMDLPKSQSSTPGSTSPLRERDFFGTPRGLSHRSSGNFDKLGRPLLYHRLPDDPGERRRSLSTTGGEDTDMRRNPFLEDGEEIDINVVDMIIHQADEQLKNGNISFSHYNTLLKQVIHLNEVQKLREAQRRDQQENKENWERSRKKRLSVEIGPEPGQLSPVSVDDGSQDARFGDIDERFPAHKPRNPVAVPPSVPSPPEPSMPASGKFSSGQSNWNDMNHPHVESGRWEPSPHPWIRGGPGPGPTSGPSAPINSGHLARTHIRLLNQGQSGTFHRPPGPEFQQMNNFGGMGRWRAPQFQSRPSFENEVDRFEPRFSGHMDNRFRIAAPIVQDHVPRPNSDELPPADPMILDLIAQDTMRTINIDGVPREIRFYGDAAVVLLAWDDPREIGFQGGTRRVIFDERDSIICTFNDTYREFLIDGNPHRIRLGAPTRELYIDDKWYEACFGGPPITIEIGGKMHSVKLEGPPPQVKIGFEKRCELVAGKINLIINARNMVPVFLDAKPQRFDIEGKPHVLRFVEALSTVLINGQPIKVEFGGLPKPIIVRGKKHFIRFTVLPRGIKPGYVTIVNMEGGRLPSPPRSENENSNSAGFSATPAAAEEDSNDASGKFQRGHDPVLPVLVRGLRRGFGSDRDSPQEAEHSRNSPAQFVGDNAVMGPVIPLQQQPRPRQQGQLPLEMLTSLMPTVMAPATGFGYQVEQDSQDGQQRPPEIQVPAPVPGVSESSLPSAGGSVTIPFLRTEINVDELFQKLVATGIVPQAEKAESDSKKDEEVKAIKPVDFKQSETLKVRQPGVVNVLYSGIQCSSCGVRFPPEQTMKYSQHLDWHFRQNRRDRDNTRKAQSRKWYYDVSDWIQFEEIEDLEERG
ncbi:hypothetical protein C0J52_07164 [Blattella germanica]|nr:hypothetical protein C0J52_07164 [Blattella germanica]